MYGFITMNNFVGEIYAEMPPEGIYHPSYMERIIELPDGVTSGWAYDWDSKQFSPPEPIEPEITTDDIIMLAIVELYEQQQASEDMIMLALAEIYELTLGGM